MAKLKPKIFLGSSSEAKPVAQAFSQSLAGVAITIPWWLAKEFEPMSNTLGALGVAAEEYDFGVFIFTPDDKYESRGEKGVASRDNVLFELGLFLGSLGADRVFGVIQEAAQKDQRVKVPSDLLGITMPTFSNLNTDDLTASVNNAAQSIANKITMVRRRQQRFDLRKSWRFDTTDKVFYLNLSAVKIDKRRERLQDSQFVLVARISNDDVNFEDDAKISIGVPRTLPVHGGIDDLKLAAGNADFFSTLKIDDRIEGHLVLLPKNINAKEYTTISAMIDAGGELLDSVGLKLMPEQSQG